MVNPKDRMLMHAFFWLVLLFSWSGLCTNENGEMKLFGHTNPKSPLMWTAITGMHKDDLRLEELESVAKTHYDWLMTTQSGARNKEVLLVAAMFDPDSSNVYASTVPGREQQYKLRTDAIKDHVAPIWWNEAKNFKDSLSRPSTYYHAEDAVYYLFEQANPRTATIGRYPSGSFITVYGRFEPKEPGTRQRLCSGGSERVPSCQNVAKALGVSFNEKGKLITPTEEEDEFNEINDEGFSDPAFLADLETLELMEGLDDGDLLAAESKISRLPLPTTANHSSAPPSSKNSIETTQHTSAQPKPAATHHTNRAHGTVSPVKTTNLRPHIVTPTPTTDTKMCKVCTPVPSTTDNCTSLKDCFVQTGKAEATVGSSPVHVGTVTGSELYTSVSNAILSLCPEPTQTTSYTSCETGTVGFSVPYIAGDMIEEGSLVVSVELSAYNLTSMRNAMINSAAMAAQQSANATNCYTQDFEASAPMKRSTAFSWLPWLQPRINMLVPEQKEELTFCNMVEFASVNYFGPYWREAITPSPTDWLDVHYSFEQQPGGDFLCDILYEADAAFAILAPEFAVGEVELGQAIETFCSSEPPER